MSVPIQVHPEVVDAITARRPVVALETAVLTHGLPHRSFEAPPPNVPPSWQTQEPLHLQTMLGMVECVRAGGAVPAAVGVIDGTLVIGLDTEQIERLADADAEKVSASNLAAALVQGVCAGTTVSATLAAARTPDAGPIRTMATGGIGGVHRGWTRHPDVSADLLELARSGVCLVCSGAKSILDLPATREALETLGVPVVGYRTDTLPRFVARGTDELGVSVRVEDAEAAAAIAHTRWSTLKQDGAVMVVNEVPASCAVDMDTLDRAVDRAERDAASRGALDAQRTPFVLDAVAEETKGRTLTANIALLLDNARLAAEVASALSGLPPLGPLTRV